MPTGPASARRKGVSPVDPPVENYHATNIARARPKGLLLQQVPSYVEDISKDAKDEPRKRKQPRNQRIWELPELSISQAIRYTNPQASQPVTQDGLPSHH
jgi:hypothetical protein